MSFVSKRLTYGFLIVSLICFSNFLGINYLVTLTTWRTLNSVSDLTLTTNVWTNDSAVFSTTTTTTTQAPSPKSLLMLFDDPKLYKGPIGKTNLKSMKNSSAGLHLF